MQLTLPTTVRGFHDYFKLTASPRDLTEAFGYQFQVDSMALPQDGETLSWLEDLEGRLLYALRHFVFDSDTARREFLIAPILFEVVRHLHISLYSEYGIQASPQLKGNLDYLIESGANLVVVEAKQSDLTRGFSQLISELLAVEQCMATAANTIYGAVSYGEVWRFGKLERREKRITQDLDMFAVPVDTEKLVRVLIAILRGETP
ncbi:hypothetical protein [Armatimonas sp.]|uniref:hypothetical protein n=1 Tax=Armatimonas sp. TaxID=1872638 RepID=UPI00374DB866